MVPSLLLKRIIRGRTRRIIKKWINEKIECNVKDPDKTHYRTQHPTLTWISKKSL